jgi:hypothetical protein
MAERARLEKSALKERAKGVCRAFAEREGAGGESRPAPQSQDFSRRVTSKSIFYS